MAFFLVCAMLQLVKRFFRNRLHVENVEPLGVILKLRGQKSRSLGMTVLKHEIHRK